MVSPAPTMRSPPSHMKFSLPLMIIEDLIHGVGVKAMDLAGRVVLQFDAALLREQVQDGGIDDEFRFATCDNLCHAACSLSSIGDALLCASLAKGQPPPALLSSCRKYCWYSRPSLAP